MKKLYQKIIVSILSFAIMGTVCAFAPVMAEASTDQPANMYFDKTYQAWWSSTPAFDFVTAGDGVTTGFTYKREDQRNTGYFGKVDYAPYAYHFTKADAAITIKIPEKENYKPSTVEVTVGHKGSSYEQPFNYQYSTDNGSTWTNVATTTYTSGFVASAQPQYYYAFCEVVKVPENATHLKVVRNNNEVTEGIGNNTKHPMVMGLEFSYKPVAMADVLTFSAKCDGEIIDLLASGIFDDGAIAFNGEGKDYDADGVSEYGFGIQKSQTVNIKPVAGYKITSVSGKFYGGTKTSNKVTVTIGETSQELKGDANGALTEFALNDEDGADCVSIKDSSGSNDGHSLFDLVITMKKTVVEDDTPEILDRFAVDKTAQAWWSSTPAFDFVTTGEGVTSGSTYRNDTHQRNTGYFGAASSAPYAYHFTKADAAITIKIPEKENYKPSAVEVTVGHKNSSYEQPFNYQYSTDNGVTWTNVANTTYTPGFVASAQAQYYYAFCEVVKVPENATHLKVVRNNNTVTEGNGNNAKYPMVMGLEFGYKPIAMADVLTFSATCDGEIIDLLASGIFADGSCGFESPTGGTSFDYDNDGTAENGFLLKKNSSATINAVEGYKITSVTGKYYGGNSAGNKITVTLGGSSKELSGYVGEDVLPVVDFEINSKVGADSLIFADNSQYEKRVLFDIVITMKKVGAVTPDGDTAMSAAIDGTKATATITNLGSAEYDTMVCILAGYNGERFMGTKMETVYKNDIDGTDMVTFYIPEGATRVKAFLWKDLETIAQVFNDIELAVPAAE